MSNNTILGIKPVSDFINVAEAALKIMQGKSPIEEEWIDDEARKVEHKWKRMNTKARVKWLAQIKVMADKEDMDKEDLDAVLSQYGLTKFDNELIWDEAQKIKPKWKKMSTAERVKWLDMIDTLAVKARTSDTDVRAILDDAGLKIKEEVEIAESIHDKKSTFTMAPFEDLRSVADTALKIMTRQPQEVKEIEEKDKDQPQQLTD